MEQHGISDNAVGLTLILDRRNSLQLYFHVTCNLQATHVMCISTIHMYINSTVREVHKSHTRTVVRECCKDDDQCQWERPKFDPPPFLHPLTDRHKNLPA